MDRQPCPRPLASSRLPPPRGPLAASKAAGHFRVDPGQTLHLAGDTDLAIDIVAGRVWLTSAGDVQDHFPADGTRLEFAAGSDVILEAEGGPARVVVTPHRRGAAIGDSLGHGLGLAAPGRPLVGVTALLRGATHGFVPAQPPSAGASARRGLRGFRGRPEDDVSLRGRPEDEAFSLRAWCHALAGWWQARRGRARARQLANSLDSRQLRDIGAADHVIHYRERLEREARMRVRMMTDGI